jgi:hypothetical protein
MCSPVILFVYNRPAETQATLTALEANQLSGKTDLYIYSDGPKNLENYDKVQMVREIIRKNYKFRSIHIIESDSNLGLANSVISGVSQILREYDKVIVLEDDLISSSNFLEFMNQALIFYQYIERIFSVSGYTLRLPYLLNYKKDFYYGYRASSWGWGTWSNRWIRVDWDLKDFRAFKHNLYQQLLFMRGGVDLPGMLRDQVKGRIDSWAIRWCYNQFKLDQLTVFPSVSKVKSIGQGANATHTKKTRRFDTDLDSGQKQQFEFEDKIEIDRKVMKEFRSCFSIQARLKDKLVI